MPARLSVTTRHPVRALCQLEGSGASVRPRPGSWGWGDDHRDPGPNPVSADQPLSRGRMGPLRESSVVLSAPDPRDPVPSHRLLLLPAPSESSVLLAVGTQTELETHFLSVENRGGPPVPSSARGVWDAPGSHVECRGPSRPPQSLRRWVWVSSAVTILCPSSWTSQDPPGLPPALMSSGCVST